MRQLFLTLLSLLLSLPALAAQDFAQKFAEEWAKDSVLETVTISPKMMEQMLGMAPVEGLGQDKRIREAIGKLRSMRIVTARSNSQLYYERATDLMDRNSTRFQQIDTFAKTSDEGAFYSRKNQQGDTVELVMLYHHHDKGRFVVVCVTGDIDDAFFRSLLDNFRY
jgi:hypothetical protein